MVAEAKQKLDEFFKGRVEDRRTKNQEGQYAKGGGEEDGQEAAKAKEAEERQRIDEKKAESAKRKEVAREARFQKYQERVANKKAKKEAKAQAKAGNVMDQQQQTRATTDVGNDNNDNDNNLEPEIPNSNSNDNNNVNQFSASTPSMEDQINSAMQNTGDLVQKIVPPVVAGFGSAAAALGFLAGDSQSDGIGVEQ